VQLPRSTRLAAAGLLAVLAAALSGCGGSAGAATIPVPSQSLGERVSFQVPSQIAHIPLTKPDGTTTTLAAFRGKAVMIADYMTLCTDICPMITADTRALAQAVQADGYGDKIELLEITVDPVRDTLPRLRAYQKLFGGPLPDWSLLRASPADSKRLWKYLGVEYGRTKEANPPDLDWWTHKPLTYDIAHSDDLIFFGPTGNERFVVNADPNARGVDTPAELVKFLSAQGRRALRHPNPIATWTVSQGLEVFSWLTNHRLPSSS
jgi:protein SCO1/2